MTKRGARSMNDPVLDAATTVIDRPVVSFGREVCGDLQAGLRREWLVTNGLGGYASGTLAGINTRRYHGLLVAALTPPVGRTVLVGGSVEWATYDGRRYPLSAHEYGGGTIDPHGYRHVEAFRLDGMLPVWTFAFGDALLERQLWMAYSANTTYIRYRLVRGTRPVDLEITPLVTYRDFHALTSNQGQPPQVEPSADAATVRWFDGAQPVRLLMDNGAFSPHGDWYYNFHHREEAARGLDDRSGLYVPGAFTMTLSAEQSATLVLTAERSPEMDSERALAAAQARQVALLHRAGVEEAHPVVQQLVLAADQFVVQRQDYQRTDDGAQAPEMGKTVIAGYHWFNEQ